MKEELSKVDRIQLEYYKVVACSLHALNRALENAVTKTFGECSMDIYNYHHYLFSHYTAQDYLGESFEHVWEEATSEKYSAKNNKLQKPVLTRWWSVVRCADQIVSDHENWIKVMNYIHDVYGTSLARVHDGSKSALAKVAKSAVEVGKSDKIMADLYFFVAFGVEYFKKHMKWLHDTNPLVKTFGHSSHEMAIRSAMMKWEIDDLIANDSWMLKPNFRTAVAKLNALPCDLFVDGPLVCAGKETTTKQWKDYFITFRDTLTKHTKSWYGKELLPFAIASSDQHVSSIFAASLSKLPIDNPASVQSPVHKCKIDLNRWKEFLSSIPDLDVILDTDCILSRHKDAITALANNSYLWDDNDDHPNLQNLKSDCQRRILPIKHHQQSAEAAVRDIGICSRTHRGEIASSALTCFRSLVCGSAPTEIRGRMISEDRVPKANHHRGADGVARSTRARKRDFQGNEDSGSKRIRVTKEKSTVLIEKTLRTFGINALPHWSDAKKRSTSDELKTSISIRVKLQTEKRMKIKASRDDRIARNVRVVSVENVKAVNGYFPLKYDGKVRIKSLRFKELKGFVCIQLKKRNIPYGEDENGRTTKGVTVLKEILSKWNQDQHPLGNAPLDINVLLNEGGEKDYDGVEWTMAKAFDIIADKTKK